MRKAAVLVVDGYEESETVTIVDLLRRAGIECHTFGFAEQYVRGMQGMMIKVDKIFSDEIKNYDMLVLPGGRPGIEFHVFWIMCFEGDHQFVLLGIVNGFLQKFRRDPMMLHGWIHRQINDMQTLILMQLIRPAGIQIILTLHKIPKCL